MVKRGGSRKVPSRRNAVSHKQLSHAYSRLVGFGQRVSKGLYGASRVVRNLGVLIWCRTHLALALALKARRAGFIRLPSDPAWEPTRPKDLRCPPPPRPPPPT